MHLTTPNNISINSQFGWIFIWVLELIVCDCTYSFICDKMIWHIEIREYKPWVLHHTLIEFNFMVKYALQFSLIEQLQNVPMLWHTGLL